MTANDRSRFPCRFWGVASLCLVSLGCQMDDFLVRKSEFATQYAVEPPAGSSTQEPAEASSPPHRPRFGLWPGRVGQPTPADPVSDPQPTEAGVAQEAPKGSWPVYQTAMEFLHWPRRAEPLVAADPAIDAPVSNPGLPRELAKMSLPPYILEPPDVVVLDAVRLTPRPPYRLVPQDVLEIHAAETLPNQPIAGAYTVDFEGNINLGYIYGAVRVARLTLDQAQAAIRTRLGQVQNKTQVSVQLRQSRGVQQLRGEHLVRPDGSISLGVYGEVHVTGMTLLQAKCAIENHLTQFLIDPDIAVDVRAYNSKVYYVVTDCGGGGEQVYIFPITGNETVLDAIGRIAGLPAVASRKRIWVARPAPCGMDYCQILPVDWRAIVRGAATRTNYQLFPGDRVYVEADGWTRLDHAVARIVAPLKSLFGIPLWEKVIIRNDGCGQGAQ